MTQLLVSVRSAEEAATALAGGANLIDVKEPRRGSLARASAPVLREIAALVDTRRPLSAALGELGELIDDDVMEALAGYSFAKVGLAGALGNRCWREDWNTLVARLPTGVSPVGVVYADATACGAPPMEDVIAHAEVVGCSALLVDTFGKDGRSLFDHWSRLQTRDFIRGVQQRKMMCVVAGALKKHHVPLITSLGADVIAVRTAVCGNGRTGDVDSSLVDNLVRKVLETSTPVGTTN